VEVSERKSVGEGAQQGTEEATSEFQAATGFGYPRRAFRDINAYVRERLTQHVRRRSQRPFRPPKGVSYYQQFQRLGLDRL
jgi:hypothetical protein